MTATTSPASTPRPSTTTIRKTDIYDDPTFNYAQFWTGRDYEHHAEVIALRRMLAGRRFGHAVDVGGGFGRISVILGDYADRVTLADPSTQQLELSERIFPGHSFIERKLMDAAHLEFADESVDLVALIRVLHHLPDPEPEFSELSRILRPGGFAVVEVANSVHAANRIRHLARRQRTSRLAVDLRSEESRQRGSAPYFNHHPRTIQQDLSAVGLDVVQVLSVSNLRHPLVKALVPERAMLSVERAAQRRLARFYFGPSTFFLLRKRAA
jgi:ubiquinone/menaquinone biosynthesis C-methylase UbiE